MFSHEFTTSAYLPLTLSCALFTVFTCDSSMVAPNNGVIYGTGNDTGTVVYFSCNNGYVLNGNEKVECTADGWSSAAPTCNRMFYFYCYNPAKLFGHNSKSLGTFLIT